MSGRITIGLDCSTRSTGFGVFEDENLITTEYEDKFSSKGMPIYSVVAVCDVVQNSK